MPPDNTRNLVCSSNQSIAFFQSLDVALSPVHNVHNVHTDTPNLINDSSNVHTPHSNSLGNFNLSDKTQNLKDWIDHSTGKRFVECPHCKEPINHGRNQKSLLQLNTHFKKCPNRVSSSDTFLQSVSSFHIHSTAPTVPCTGFIFPWNLGLPYATYPFPTHAGNVFAPGFKLEAVDEIRSTITVRSPLCSERAYEGETSCRACSILGPKVEVVLEQAREGPGSKRTNALSHKQLRERLDQANASLKEARLACLNHIRNAAHAEVKLEKYATLCTLIAMNDIPALHRIFRNANTQQWSIDKLIEKIQDAIDGNYHPKGYSDYEKNLAILMYKIGGGAAVYALNHATTSLPSRQTISPLRQEFSLRISVAGMRMIDVMENIRTVFEGYAPGARKCLVNLCQDEIACESRPRWLAETDCLYGLCEHAKSLGDLRLGNDMMTLERAAKAVKAGNVHIAHEVSVASFSLYHDTYYDARPVLMMPTCKKGDWTAAALQNTMLLAAWKLSPYGAAVHGDSVSFGTDEDALYQWLGNLPGLNLLCGPNFETPLFDPKHDIKHIGACTLLSSIEGMVVNDVIINKTLLSLWFQRFDGHDWTNIRIEDLSNFGDHQDIPRAFTLLCFIADLCDLDTSDFDPSEMHTYRSLKLLGKLWGNLVEPFLLLELDLFDQVKRLVKFAHLAFALYCKNGQSFMTPQLYGDLQAMIKNAVFVVALTKNLDPLIKVLAALFGDDVLEVFFGRARMKGEHDPNCDVLQLKYRFESGLRKGGIFTHYPELERRPRRLMTSRLGSTDHRAPRYFTGNLTAGSCDLFHAFSEAKTEILDDLNLAGFEISGKSFSFKERWSPQCDLQRPIGGRYPGLSKALDRSISDAAEYISSSGSSNEELSNEALAEVVKILKFDAAAMLAAEKEEDLKAGPTSYSPFFYTQSADGNTHKVAKQTAVREIMNPGFDLDNARSHDRLLRVRYFAESNDWHTKHVSTLIDDRSFKIGSIFATLVYIPDRKLAALQEVTKIPIVSCRWTLGWTPSFLIPSPSVRLYHRSESSSPLAALAIVHCTSIRGDGAHSHVPFDEISLPQSKYNVSGQILELMPTVDTNSSTYWDWTSTSMELEPEKKVKLPKKDDSRAPLLARNLRIEVNGTLIHPLHPAALTTISDDQLSADIQPQLGRRKSTWRFSNDQLLSWLNILQHRIREDDSLRELMPIHLVRRGNFPYTLTGHNHEICHASSTISMPSCLNNPRKTCSICQKSVKNADRYSHMGKHILHKRHTLPGTEDYPILAKYPCGFCGNESSSTSCNVQIDGRYVQSTCPDSYRLQIWTAASISKANPSTNIPLKCLFSTCKEVHWKYNMYQHLTDRHPTWKSNVSTSVAADFEARITISHEEKSALGILENLIAQGESTAADSAITTTDPALIVPPRPDSSVAPLLEAKLRPKP
ncbi:hypothetical protein BT96DRAFT_1005306 [Gymnopus androsaceus JB14]|uniref:Uncharacterized protein n=1 Tax=Gymnopus androsaceus JB14 TaxID=1447944 RepID=A0A6A4GPL2_9AGAR|nr:hypothetical protein BT96DRAFT_1005306 [Gymnopus androsaceus JB14]